jgi:hypothetical protein
VNNSIDDEKLVKLRRAAGELRRRMEAIAAAIAATEDDVAGTLDRLARTRPHDQQRLHARAASARRFAAQERELAARCADMGRRGE